MSPDVHAVAARYARFARDEAPGRSALYEMWARGVAGDPDAADIVARIPETHRQPPLVFAVTRLLGAPEGDYREWAEWLSAHADAVVAEASRRRLQTNEPLRCAALLPALTTVEGPIALLELGASAGLCLFPDRYSYRYGGGPSLDPADGPSRVVLHSALRGEPPAVPEIAMPEIVWRAGIDVEPLSATDAADRRFLSALVWPGETGRGERIAAALDIAAADPPRLVRGDASEPSIVRALADEAPTDATLVVTTPGLLPHVPRAGRERLIGALTTMDAVWITLDPPALHRAWRPPVEPATWDGFVLARDGAVLAAADPLGAFVEWRAGDRRARS